MRQLRLAHFRLYKELSTAFGNRQKSHYLTMWLKIVVHTESTAGETYDNLYLEQQ